VVDLTRGLVLADLFQIRAENETAHS
jgi:hypothetical protein